MTEAVEDDDLTSTFRLTEGAVAKDPGDYFDRLRSRCPVSKNEDFGGFWMLSRYDDVHEAALNTEVFSSASGVTIPVVPQPPVICLEQDDPEHRKYRKPMQGWFSVKRMSELEQRVRGIVTTCIDEIIDDKHGDLAAAIAAPVPPVVIALLLGLPETDWQWFRDRENAFLELAAAGDQAGSAAAVQEIKDYLSNSLEDRRRSPKDDMLTEIVSLTFDGEPIADEHAISLAFLILGAGHETTVGGLGGLLYQVAKDSELRDRLIADPSLIDAAVEEALRLETPLMGLGRRLATDTAVDGTAMPEGDRVMLLWGAANRDPAMFESPEEFRLDRTNHHKHLSFGAGVHRCVGAPLAKLEMRVVLEEVLRRMPQVRLLDVDTVRVHWTVGRAFEGLHAIW